MRGLPDRSPYAISAMSYPLSLYISALKIATQLNAGAHKRAPESPAEVHLLSIWIDSYGCDFLGVAFHNFEEFDVFRIRKVQGASACSPSSTSSSPCMGHVRVEQQVLNALFLSCLKNTC